MKIFLQALGYTLAIFGFVSIPFLFLAAVPVDGEIIGIVEHIELEKVYLHTGKTAKIEKWDGEVGKFCIFRWSRGWFDIFRNRKQWEVKCV